MPARPIISAQQYPLARAIQKSQSASFTPEERREVYGKLLFTTTNGNSPALASNSIQYEIGRVLTEFNAEIFDILNMGVPDDVDIQHNNNTVNIASSVLSDDETFEVERASRSRLSLLRTDLAGVKAAISKNINSIRETQKNINDISDVISAVSVIEGTDTSIREKLESKRSESVAQLSDLLEQRDGLALSASELYDDIRALSVVVR